MHGGADADGLRRAGQGAVVGELLPPRRQPIGVEPHPEQQLPTRTGPAVHALGGRHLVVRVVGDPLQRGGAGSAHGPLELEHHAVRHTARVVVGAGQSGTERIGEDRWSVVPLDDLDPRVLADGAGRDLEDHPDPPTAQDAPLVDIGHDLGRDLAEHPERCAQGSGGLLGGVVDRPGFERRHRRGQRTDAAVGTDLGGEGILREAEQVLDLTDRRVGPGALGVAVSGAPIAERGQRYRTAAIGQPVPQPDQADPAGGDRRPQRLSEAVGFLRSRRCHSVAHPMTVSASPPWQRAASSVDRRGHLRNRRNTRKD